ncbi:DUF742 domain-containing protein [Streptacidiphilus cavernicola]|uniref:DUF742 domain-containing protein n=1 Tax=Streptacidiphilus cavernicola TaxID=3342716 RepID=A0ABV6W3P0_9ACTN
MNAATGGPSEPDGRGRSESGSGFGSGPVFDGTYDRVADRLRAGRRAAGPDQDADDGGAGWTEDAWTEDDAAAEDEELSRLVRPYTLTRGRTRHAEGAVLDVIAQVIAADWTGLAESEAAERTDGPEYQAILELVRERPLSVAEVAVGTDLPLGVARILLGDLLEADLIRVSRPVPTAELPDTSVLRDVIRGLRAL